MFKVEGVKTSVALHQRILESEEFIAGRVDTHFMERFLSKE